MISRKVVAGGRQMLAQVYLKRGAHVPLHRHASEQMTYVLQGSLRCRVGPDEIVVRAGEVLHIPPGRPHQAEALEDTFEIDVFSPVRDDWLDPPGGERPAPGTPVGAAARGTRVSRRCPRPCLSAAEARRRSGISGSGPRGPGRRGPGRRRTASAAAPSSSAGSGT